MATQVMTAMDDVRTASPNRPVRTPSASNGSSSKAGYNLAATPRPMRTPARAGRRRAQASRPPVAKAVARASKLVKIWKIRIGETATSAASQMRRPASIAVAQTVASHARANPKAEMLKNITTSATPDSTGALAALAMTVYVLASDIATYW